MKLKVIIFVLIFLLIGCYTHISGVKKKWGPPAKIEYRGDTIIYSYYFYKQKGGAIIPAGSRGAIVMAEGTAGWVVVEITTDKNGKILSKRKYWKQPELK